MFKEIKPYPTKLAFTIIIGLLLFLIYHGINILLLLFTGALLAILWRGISWWLSARLKIPFRYLLPVVILLNIGSIVAFFWLSAPNIGEQVDRLVQEIPIVVQELKRDMESTNLGRRIITAIENSQEDAMSNIMGEMGRVFNVFSVTIGVVIDILLVLIFALFLVANPRLYIEGFLHLVPEEKTGRIREVIRETKNTLFRWFIGKIADMLSIFILTLIGLWILGMPLVFTFALIAFLFSFVPNIGPIISVVPPMAIAFLEGPKMPLYVGLLYLGIQLFESYFITPKIQQRAAFVPPVLLLLVQFLFAAFIGVLGLLLATPILVAFMVVIKMLYVEDYLNDHSVETIKAGS